MYGKLERLVNWPLAAVAAVTLWAVALALWPSVAEAAPVPAVGSAALAAVSDPPLASFAEDGADGRRLLGLSVLALILLAGALMARTLPVGRQGPGHGVWGPRAVYPAVFPGSRASPEVHPDRVTTSRTVPGPAEAGVGTEVEAGAGEPDADEGATEAPAATKANDRRGSRAGAVEAARRRRLRYGSKGKRRPLMGSAARGGTVTGAYGPKNRLRRPRARAAGPPAGERR